MFFASAPLGDPPLHSLGEILGGGVRDLYTYRLHCFGGKVVAGSVARELLRSACVYDVAAVLCCRASQSDPAIKVNFDLSGYYIFCWSLSRCDQMQVGGSPELCEPCN